MNSGVAGHLHCKRDGTPSFKGRSWIVSVAVFTLMGLALYSGIFFLRDRPELDWPLIEFFTVSGMAVAYAFGFFWYFPDVLSQASLDHDTLHRRWSDFSLLTAFITLIVTNVAYARTICVNSWLISVPIALAIVSGYLWLLPACVVASGRYLSWTLPVNSDARLAGWLSLTRRAIQLFGGWLIDAVRGQRSLMIGASLVLASLFLPVRADPWDWHVKGFHFALGRHSTGGYPTMHEIPWSDLLVGHGRRLVYILALGIAVAAFIVSAFRRRLPRCPSFPFLTIITGSVAFFEVVDLRLGEYEIPTSVVPILWIFACLLPVTLWIVLARGTSERHERVRLGLMLFALPIFFVGFSFLPVQTYFSLGTGALVAGLLFLWWGLLQQREGRL